MLRREFLALVAKAAALATTAAVLRPSSDYGPVQQPNELGLMLPAQFSARRIATSGQPVGNTGFVWHLAPDGGACVPTPGGGWVYVSNCELPSGAGGVNAIKFSPAGEILSVYRPLR